ncbi:MAG TPA: YciI family protein [Candidatus Dormibacteraeota bacterium]
MKYVLMFVGSSEDQGAWENMSKEEREAAYEASGKWFEEHSRAGRIVGGEELQGPSSSTTVRIKNGKAIVTDGPYIEAKEIIGGFAIVEVKDLDEALAMAKGWPAGAVEVRPVVDHSADIEQAETRRLSDAPANG